MRRPHRPIIMMPIIVMFMTALLAGCTSPKTERAMAEGPAVKVISRDQAIGELPCFRCHSFDKFSAQPQKGIFSHRLHIDSGYHCNQCHEFQGHKHISLNKDVCGKCHSIKNITFNKTAMPSRFDHVAHTKRYACNECHPRLFLMKAGSAHITMQDINSGAYCGACHDGKKAFPSGDCARCHNMSKGFDKELLYKVDGMGPVTFSHKFHTGAFPCENCHPKIFAMKKTQGKMTMDEINKGKQCGVCHNGTVATAATECGMCHK